MSLRRRWSFQVTSRSEAPGFGTVLHREFVNCKMNLVIGWVSMDEQSGVCMHLSRGIIA